ncbi:MAG TPA: radical SAM protein [Desulfomonilaceae bacterium]|nr:radical SAM protein [Desulfomonilaceae bacterium]
MSRLTGASCPIQALSLEITHRCIARCTMCNIWKIPDTVEDLPLSEWLKLLASSELKQLREIDITGGEPFLRNDIVNLVEAISRSKRDRYPKLRTVAVTTNGLLTQRILKGADVMAGHLNRSHIDMVFAVALDAIGELHDNIRGVPGAWPKVLETIEGLCRLRNTFPNLVIGVKTTIIPKNVGHLEDIAIFAQERGLFTIISPRILTGVRYGNLDRADDLVFTKENLDDLAMFCSSDLFRGGYHRKVLMDLFEKGRVTKPCTAGFNYFFVRSTGDVYPCPLTDCCLGNIQRSSLGDLVQSSKARGFRRQCGTFTECETCTEPGLERYALPFEAIAYGRLMNELSYNDFVQLHRHIGLDKYLP